MSSCSKHKPVLSPPSCHKVRTRPSFIVTDLSDSTQSTEPSPHQSTPLLAQLMTLKQRGGGFNWTIFPETSSVPPHPPAPPVMYACPLLSLGAHGSYLSLCGSSGTRRCHAGSLLDCPHCVSLWPLFPPVTTQGRVHEGLI